MINTAIYLNVQVSEELFLSGFVSTLLLSSQAVPFSGLTEEDLSVSEIVLSGQYCLVFSGLCNEYGY